MRNYLTGKERLLVALLAFILPFSFAKAEVKEYGKTISQGWYVGIEGGMPFDFSTFSSYQPDLETLIRISDLQKVDVNDLLNKECIKE